MATAYYRKRSHICYFPMWSHYHHKHGIVVLIVRGCFHRKHGWNKLFLHSSHDKLSRFFSCISLIRDHTIFLVLFGVNKHLRFFSKIISHLHPKGSFNFVSLWKNFTRAYLFQIALEIKWLPIQTEAKIIIPCYILHPAYFVSHHAAWCSCLSRISLSEHFPFVCFSLRSLVVISAEINY